MAKNKIHIDPSKRGTFTSAANKRNKTVKQFTNMVLSNKDKYSPKMVRKAIFARNASKWNKKREGGDIVSTMGYRDDSPFRNSESLNIYSPEGFIDMSNVGMPIMANGQRLEPYSGLNQVPPSSSGYVKETPLIAQRGGSIVRISPEELKKRTKLRDSLNQPKYYNNRRINTWTFISPEELDIVTGGGINFPSGTGVNALGIIPRTKDPVYKGMGILGVSQQLGPNWNIGAEVSSPFLRDWETRKLQTNIQPSLKARYNIPYKQNKPKRKSAKYLQNGGNDFYSPRDIYNNKQIQEHVRNIQPKSTKEQIEQDRKQREDFHRQKALKEKWLLHGEDKGSIMSNIIYDPNFELRKTAFFGNDPFNEQKIADWNYLVEENKRYNIQDRPDWFKKYGGSVPNIPTYYQDSGTPIYRDTTDAPPTIYQKGGNIYNVKSGDTFYGIANRHNMSKQNLIDANPGININALKLNQPINIPLRPADGLEYQVYNNKGKSYRPSHFYRKAGNYWQIKGPNTEGKYVTITDPTRLSNIDRDARVFEDPRYMMPKVLPQEYLDHLRLREGIRNKSYLDSEGKLTGGIGHLMSSAEKKQYPLGTNIPPSVIEKWYKEDSKKAYKAALKQAKELKVDNPKFINSLASVNFQLGPAWNTKHTETWKLLKEGKFKEAAIEAADSKWNTQTPKRVKDFQEGISNLYKYGGAMISKKNIYKDGGPINNKYFNIEGVNPSKLKQWYSLGKKAPTSINEAFLLAEAVGYPPSQAKIVAAQWALESARGTKVGGDYNYFGIKSHSKAVRDRLANKYGLNISANTPKETREEIDGKIVKQKSSFLNFEDPIAAFLGHKAFLETNNRYKDALTKITPYEFAKGLKDAGYATSSKYVGSLGKIIKPLLDEKEFNKFSIIEPTKSKPSNKTGRLDKSHALTYNKIPENQQRIINDLPVDQQFNILEDLKNIEDIKIIDIDNSINNQINQLNLEDVKLAKKNPYIDKLNVNMPVPKRRPQFGQGQLFKKYGGIIKKY